MAAKPKRVQGRKGRPQLPKKGRGPGRRPKAEVGEMHAMGAREPNGHEERAGSEEMEQPGMAASQLARLLSEQIKQAGGPKEWAGATPQVFGWAGTGPAEQLESMVRQFWNLGANGEPSRYMKAMAQANAEMVGLMGRRSRAYLDLPAHLARCRTPQQVLDEQAKFLQEMLHDYQVTNDRVMSAWREAAAPSPQ